MGLIVFGIIVVLLIHFDFKTMSGEHEFDFGTGGANIPDTYVENGENQFPLRLFRETAEISGILACRTRHFLVAVLNFNKKRGDKT